MKDQAIDAVVSRLNFCVNSLTPHASKNKCHKPYFFTHVVTVALSSSKILTDGKLQDDNKNTYEANILCSLTFQSISNTNILFA